MMGSYMLILFVFLVEGVFADADEVKSVMEGDLVTLNTSVIMQQQDMVRWYFNDALIAVINRDPSTSCKYDGEDGRFRDRLKVDYETGSLTITDIRSEHTGRYEAELFRSESSGKSERLNINRKCDSTKILRKSSILGEIIKSISLTVSGVFADADEVKSVMEGDLVALNTSVIMQQQDMVRWYFNDALIAVINRDPSTSCKYDGEDGRFRDRLKVDYETGSLTITDIRSEHTGRYEAELFRSQSSGKSERLNINRKCDSTKILRKSSILGEIIKSISLTVSAVPDSGRSSAAVAGISAGVAVLCCWLQLLVV